MLQATVNQLVIAVLCEPFDQLCFRIVVKLRELLKTTLRMKPCTIERKTCFCYAQQQEENHILGLCRPAEMDDVSYPPTVGRALVPLEQTAFLTKARLDELQQDNAELRLIIQRKESDILQLNEDMRFLRASWEAMHRDDVSLESFREMQRGLEESLATARLEIQTQRDRNRLLKQRIFELEKKGRLREVLDKSPLPLATGNSGATLQPEELSIHPLRGTASSVKVAMTQTGALFTVHTSCQTILEHVELKRKLVDSECQTSTPSIRVLGNSRSTQTHSSLHNHSAASSIGSRPSMSVVSVRHSSTQSQSTAVRHFACQATPVVLCRNVAASTSQSLPDPTRTAVRSNNHVVVDRQEALQARLKQLQRGEVTPSEDRHYFNAMLEPLHEIPLLEVVASQRAALLTAADETEETLSSIDSDSTIETMTTVGASATIAEEPRIFAPEPYRCVHHRGTSPPMGASTYDVTVQVGLTSYRLDNEAREVDELRRRCDRLQRLWDRAQCAFKKSLECIQDENWKLRDQFRDPSP